MRSRKFVVAFMVAVTLLVVGLPALAHEHREVGPYEITFGWRVEPAYAGIYNGPSIEIINLETNEPVEGAETTLLLDISLGDQSKRLPLRRVLGSPGEYTSDLIPVLPGDYSFHLTGMIGDLAINETFTSADGGFSSIELTNDIVFPEFVEPDLISLINALQTQVDELRARLDTLSE